MAQFGRTWWGQRFIAALEEFTDAGRLGRGRSYAHNGRILEYTIADGKVAAKVRGSINPYFGVYKEPTYKTAITIKAISATDWTKVIRQIASRADLVTKLLMNEMPDTIDDAFAELGLHLLPHSERDFVTTCSCPDYANPCKHIAGVYYLLASALDKDPFVMFELRGLSRDDLRAELMRSPLGQILASALVETEVQVEPVESYYTRPKREAAGKIRSHKEFWTGARRLPALQAQAAQGSVPALLIKKQGDYPAFWHKDASFIGAMEELYGRVREKNKQIKPPSRS
ncbi:MAG TPA: SWIM zinc finger family protein [Ktedonobacteraceae bacterium]|nr:SWIM zinc finger family protein [Ktedonobacteraceae bacterium]